MNAISELKQDWTEQASQFWDYATHCFHHPDIAVECLQLQDNFGFDINLLLLCGWLGRQHITLPQTILQTLLDNTQEWRTRLLQPFRGLRTCAKPGPEQHPSRHKAYDALKKAESLMERHYQYLLLSSLPNSLDPQHQREHTDCCRQSLANYGLIMAYDEDNELMPLALALSQTPTA